MTRRRSPPPRPGAVESPTSRCGGGQRPQGQLDPLEGGPVVDDPRTRLGHAVGGHHVGRPHRRRAGSRPGARAANTAGSRRASAVATRETCVAVPSRPAASTVPRLEPGMTTSGVPVCRAGVTTESPPMCASGRQASQVWRPGRRRGAPWWRGPRPRTASWVSTTPLGPPDGPDVAMTSASPASTPAPPGNACCSPSEPTITRGAKRLQHGPAWPRPGSRGSRGAAASPVSHTAAQRVDEPRPTWEVECDELGHRPVA